MLCRFVPVLVTMLALAPAVTPVQKDKLLWLDDVAAAQAESRRSGKPIFTVLH